MKKTNLADVRVQNAHIILHELELHDATTNTDIAMAHHLSIPTVTKIINVLNQNALVRYLGENQSSGGRRAKRIGLNPITTISSVCRSPSTLFLLRSLIFPGPSFILIIFTVNLKILRRIGNPFEILLLL